MSQEYLELINTFAAVFSALGTVAAVVVALWLASRDERLRLRCSAQTGGIMHVTSSGFGVTVSISNKGRRTANINGFGFRFGWIQKRSYFWKLDPNTFSDSLPKKLEDGEQAVYFISEDDFDRNIKNIAAELPWLTCRFLVSSMKLEVQTSNGRVFRKKVSANLKSHVADLLKK